MKYKIFFIFFIFCVLSNAQNKKELTVEQKNYILKFVHPLSSFEPTYSNDDDLKILEKFIGNSRIVGLGESTHGSSEIYKMKDRISRYLITNKEFNVFSLEANMPESFVMNKYIIDNDANPKKILNSMYFWIWQTDETLNFIEWLKSYNENSKLKVHFDGFDMQYYFGAVKQLKDVYEHSNFPVEEIEILEKTLKERSRGIKSYNKKSQKIIGDLIEPIKQRGELISDLKMKNRFLLNIKIIVQSISLSTSVKRDLFMSENINRIAENYDNSKVIVSAHNSHISKLNSSKMGFHLDKIFGNNYVNFGFAFYEGKYTARINKKIGTYTSQTAYDGTLESYLHSLNIPIFIIDLKSIKKENNKLAKWILSDIPSRKTGSGEDGNEFKKMNVVNSYDYLIFIDKSTNSNLFNYKEK